jgi:hypothetical protein
MALYILTYDLRKARDYQTLWDEMEKFNAVRILESDWCFRRINTTAAGLRDYFRNFIDLDDGLFVAEMSETQWASVNCRGTPKDLA